VSVEQTPLHARMGGIGARAGLPSATDHDAVSVLRPRQQRDRARRTVSSREVHLEERQQDHGRMEDARSSSGIRTATSGTDRADARHLE
jgi:hypothetical protein